MPGGISDSETRPLEQVRALAIELHGSQRDPDGTLHIAHCKRVAGSLIGENARTVAFLHDVLEDTDADAQTLRDAGIAETAIEAVECLTRRTGETYDDYLVRLVSAAGESGELARMVKTADAWDNYRRSLQQHDQVRKEKYLAVLRRLAAALQAEPGESESHHRAAKTIAPPALLSAGESRISTVDDWFEHCPPRGGAAQFVAGRSAMEFARAWCGGGCVEVPSGFGRLLTSHPLLEGLHLQHGYPEHATPLRGEQRGPRVHDMLLIGSSLAGRVVIGVEAKTDETFGQSLDARWQQAQAKRPEAHSTHRPGRLEARPTQWPARLERLVPALLGVSATVNGRLNPVVAHLPDQLLAALAGTLIEAEENEAALAVLVAHVFITSKTRSEIVAANKRAFATFARQLDATDAVADGQLYGPFDVPGGGRIPVVPALIGIVTTQLQL